MVLAIGFNLMLLLGVGIYLLNDDDYRRVAIWSADYFLDSRLEIDGDFSLRIGHQVELTAETVRLKANDGSYDLSVGKLNVGQRFGSYLWTGTLWINHLNLENLRGEIRETGNGGEFDWQAFSLPFVVIEEIQLSNMSLVYTEANQQRHTIELSHISLDDTDNRGPVKVSAAGVMNARPLRLEGTLGSLKQLRSDNQTYPFDFILSNDTGDAGSNKQIIELDGTVGHTASGSSQVDSIFDLDIPQLVSIFSNEIAADKLGHLQGNFIAVEEGGRWRIRKTQFASNATDAYQLRVDGSVENSGQFELHSEFGVSDPAAFGARFGIDLARYAPFKGKGLISGDKTRLNYQGKMSIGRIESETALTASLGNKPQIKGKISIAELYLADIGINQRLSLPTDASATANPDTNEQPESEASASVSVTSVTANPDTGEQPKPEAQAPTSADSQSILNREPLDFSGLQDFNLDLEILVDKVIGTDFSVDKLEGQVKLNDGALQISPMRVTLEGGHADLELAVDARNTPSVALKVMGDDLQLGGVVPHTKPELQLAGKARLHIDIKSKGKSVHDLVSALSGDIKLDLEKVRLPRQYVDYLSTDELEPAAAGDAYTMLEMDGAVAIKFGSEVELSAETVRLRTNDGSYDVALGKMYLQQNLAHYLATGDFSIQRLNMADLHVEVVESEIEEHDPSEHEWHEFDFRFDDIPLIIVERMDLNNLSLVYTSGDEQDTASLSHFVLDNDNSEEPLTMSMSGKVNQRTLQLEGTLGTPAEPRGKNRIFPINYILSSGTVEFPPRTPLIKVNGKIDRTLPAGGLFAADFDVNVSALISVFNQEKIVESLGRLQGSFEFVDVDGRWGMTKLDLTSADSELYQLKMSGAVKQDGDKFELHSELDVPDPAVFGAQFGLDLTGYAAYRGVGVFTGTRSVINYRGETSIGRIENETTLNISLAGGKPLIQGKFVTPNLYLADIGLGGYLGVDPNAPDSDDPVTASPHADEAEKSEEPALLVDVEQVIFDREPLDFSGLQHFNLDLEILIDHITGVDFAIEKLEGAIKLTDGVLRIYPMRLTLEGGTTDLELELDTRNTPSVTLKITADDLQLGKLIAKAQEAVPVEGKAHLNIDITSTGHSAHELASDLSGKLSFSLENARVPKKYVEFLTADLFGFLFRSFTFEDSYATLNCVVTGFEVDQGIAKSVLMFGEGPRLAVDGTATVDLGQETIDMVLFPKTKKRLGLDYSSITVTGSLADPDVETSGTGAATAAAVGGVILIPQVIIPVFLIEQVWQFFSSNDDTGCNAYIEKHKDEVEEFVAE
jgi:uncharacterized protein involved in outer membrane biogenesis